MSNNLNNLNINFINNLKLVIKISFIYISSILGAGFATGHELVTFFAIYSYFGIFTFFLSCILIGIFVSAVLYALVKIKPISYKFFLQRIFGSNIGKVIYLLNIAFMFVLFSAMLSGGGNLLVSIFFDNSKINTNFLLLEHIGAIIFALLIAFILFIFNNNLLEVNNILCPLIILGGIIIGLLNISPDFSFNLKNILNYNYNSNLFINPILSFIIYSSYNLITTIAILYSFNNYNINNYTIKYSGFLSFIFIFLAGIFLLISLISNLSLVYNKELPILFILQNNNILKFIYEFILLIAIFTTAISNAFAILDIFYNRFKISKSLLIIIICILGASFAMIGFSNIVDIVYPIFGSLGIFQVLVILLNFIFKNY